MEIPLLCIDDILYRILQTILVKICCGCLTKQLAIAMDKYTLFDKGNSGFVNIRTLANLDSTSF